MHQLVSSVGYIDSSTYIFFPEEFGVLFRSLFFVVVVFSFFEKRKQVNLHIRTN